MNSVTFDTIRHQTRFAVHVATRDVGKRLASAAMMMGILWFIGQTMTALMLSALIVAYEILAQKLGKRLPERDEDMRLTYLAGVWLVNCTSVVVYLIPALPLASEPSSAMLLAGFLWLFGVFVHVSNTYVALPFYNWSLMIPSFGAAFVVFWLAAKNAFLPSQGREWIITTSMMVVYIFNTYQTLIRQKDTQRALNVARNEANARLRALEHLSRHDTLTGLKNRRAFDDALTKLLIERKLPDDVGVFVIDLDGFKPINDTYSHEAGDHVLRTIANRIEEHLGARDVSARLGGDEFAMAVARGVTEPTLEKKAEKLARAIRTPIVWKEKELQIGVSIGVSAATLALPTVESLCATADQAMYRAKTTGQNVCLFSPDLIEDRPSLEQRKQISAAIQNGDIRPFYQPKVDMATGQTIGFEALARWVLPNGDVRFPGEFIPQINHFGLHGDFMLHMTACALRNIDELLAEGIDPGQISVNVPEVALATHSGRNDLDELLRRYPQARRHMSLEITEDVFIARSADIIQESIAHFRSVGLRVSLDDFGTGFASFQHLRELEFDELKIDTSFVRGLEIDPTAQVLVKGFLDIARGLGVDVIAEGVETEAQMHHLFRMGCRFAQGFLYGRAMPFDETRIRLIAASSRSSEGVLPLTPVATLPPPVARGG